MIDIKDLEKRSEEYQTACINKNIKLDISKILEKVKQFNEVKTSFETKRAEQNKVSKEMPNLSGSDKESKLEEMKKLSSEVKKLKEELSILEQEKNTLLLRIPAIPLKEVPIGKTDEQNVEIYKVGEPVSFDFEIRDHVELGKIHDIVDIERGVKVAGARSYFLKGYGMLLQHAILSLARDLLMDRGYTVMECPHLVRKDVMEGTGYFPGGEDMAYHLDQRDDDFYLIGTSEVSVCAYYSGEIVDVSKPIKLAGYSPCYRREAGTYGKDTHGLYRIHQFYKVEQVILCENDPEVSKQMHNELLKNSEDLMKILELPYRVVKVCTGDMGQGQVFKHDIEAWMPSRKSYGETHSCSTFLDFQSRRLNIKYKNSEGKNTFCHTLNNTCVASPRILIPVIENNQLENGDILIPKALQKYMNGLEVIKTSS